MYASLYTTWGITGQMEDFTVRNLKLTRKRFTSAVFASAFLLMASKTYADFTAEILSDSEELCNWHNGNQYWCPPYPSETDISWGAYILSNQFAYSSYKYIDAYMIQIQNGNSVNTTDLYESFVVRFLNRGLIDDWKWQYDFFYEELMSPRVKVHIQDNFIHPTLNFLMSRPYSNDLRNNLYIYANGYHLEKKAICFLDSLASNGLLTMYDSAGSYYPQDWCRGGEVTIINN